MTRSMLENNFLQYRFSKLYSQSFLSIKNKLIYYNLTKYTQNKQLQSYQLLIMMIKDSILVKKLKYK